VTQGLREFTQAVYRGATKAFVKAGVPERQARSFASKFLSSLTRLNGHRGRALSMTVLFDCAFAVIMEKKPEAFGREIVKQALQASPGTATWGMVKLPVASITEVQIAKRRHLGASRRRSP
jgi:hypothetical protein